MSDRIPGTPESGRPPLWRRLLGATEAVTPDEFRARVGQAIRPTADAGSVPAAREPEPHEDDSGQDAADNGADGAETDRGGTEEGQEKAQDGLEYFKEKADKNPITKKLLWMVNLFNRYLQNTQGRTDHPLFQYVGLDAVNLQETCAAILGSLNGTLRNYAAIQPYLEGMKLQLDDEGDPIETPSIREVFFGHILRLNAKSGEDRIDNVIDHMADVARDHFADVIGFAQFDEYDAIIAEIEDREIERRGKKLGRDEIWEIVSEKLRLPPGSPGAPAIRFNVTRWTSQAAPVIPPQAPPPPVPPPAPVPAPAAPAPIPASPRPAPAPVAEIPISLLSSRHGNSDVNRHPFGPGRYKVTTAINVFLHVHAGANVILENAQGCDILIEKGGICSITNDKGHNTITKK